MDVVLVLSSCHLPQAIIGALGAERRNRVLSGLYMGRSDTQLVVRQASLHVWKIVVSNTPRTLREILPTLFTLLLGFLASTCPDKRTVLLHTSALSQPPSSHTCLVQLCLHGHRWHNVSDKSNSCTVHIHVKYNVDSVYGCVVVDRCPDTWRPGEEAGREDPARDHSHPGGEFALREE